MVLERPFEVRVDHQGFIVFVVSSFNHAICAMLEGFHPEHVEILVFMPMSFRAHIICNRCVIYNVITATCQKLLEEMVLEVFENSVVNVSASVRFTSLVESYWDHVGVDELR